MIVNCAAYQDGKKLADIGIGEVSEYLSRPGCFVWIALCDPTPEEFATMSEQFGLHPLAIEDARKGHQRPKIEEYEDSLFVVLHNVELAQGEAAEDLIVNEVDIFTGSNYVISVRPCDMKGFTSVRARCEREPELLRRGPGFVLYALMDAVVDRYFSVLDALGSSLEGIENRLFDGSSTRHRIEELYALKRRLMVLKHAVAPLEESLGKLYGGRVPQLCATTQEYFRDVDDHLRRIHAEIESIREMQATAISVNIALISLSESEVTKRLAAWGALITVPTLIAGVYGMNFDYMPELHWTLGYPFALALMVVADVVLFRRFKRVKWL